MFNEAKLDLSEFAYKKKDARQVDGTVYHVEILHALPAEKTITLTRAGK